MRRSRRRRAPLRSTRTGGVSSDCLMMLVLARSIGGALPMAWPTRARPAFRVVGDGGTSRRGMAARPTGRLFRTSPTLREVASIRMIAFPGLPQLHGGKGISAFSGHLLGEQLAKTKRCVIRRRVIALIFVLLLVG